MYYNREAHQLLEDTLKVLQTKRKHAYPYMVGLLMPNVPLTEAKRIAKIVEEMESEND
jgi:hypothetical protein